MNEFILAIMLEYNNKCGKQIRTEMLRGFPTEIECRKGAEQLKMMYLRTGKTNVSFFEYVCYEGGRNELQSRF